MIPLEHYLLLSAFLLCVGLVVVVTKRNAIVILIGIELMLNAANINLVAFSRHDPVLLQGQMFALFVIVVAAAEAAVAMAIILKVYSFYKTANVDDIREMQG
ncbi:NADH-quinone oxidoreductase subunit NuoK [Tunicatimonas pelagia]|uniref:NADH-quinone oxidoreductase subunit NuoK n=1 Tax=Tunicatimonas pelagia TaxID=931531 RepID=UPI0026661540|nr:NADH-quinone oxidoreductase subunit NuoK [Tunicatimonas pelagia]WKN44778.1 NADH-quinone oxidoreductase subunit NuoK [Tunicatimonas pelagia]